jgi:hypothetical protein
MCKENKYNFIYKTTSKFNGKFYIGMHSTDSLDDGYLGSGTKLLSEMAKYGRDKYSIDILEFCDTREVLIKREKEIVNTCLINDWYCLNLIEGGDEYKKGDKIYNNRFDIKTWKNLEYVYIIKNGEVKNVIINLLPYYENTGWLLCVDNKIIDIEETKRLKIIADNTVKLEYCNIIKDGEARNIIKNFLESYIKQGWVLK